MATRELAPEEKATMTAAARHAAQQLSSQKGRLTDRPNGQGVDRRPLDEKLQEKATLETALQIIHQNERTIDTVRDSVVAIYRGGKNNFTSQDVEAVAMVAYNMGLDPSPASGQLWAWKDWQGNLIIMVGYQGYLAKAREQFEFVISPARPCTADERKMLECDEGDVAVCVELFDMKMGRMWKELGLPVQPIRSYGVWQKKARYQKAYRDKRSKKLVEGHWVEDNVPSTKSKFWVAEKRAIMDAIRKLGVQFNMTIPKLDGMVYDSSTDSFYMESVNYDESEVIDGTVAETTVTEPEPEKTEPIPPKPRVVDGNGRRVYDVPTPEPTTVEAIIDAMETEDGPEDTINADELPVLSVTQIGELRHLIRKSLDLGNTESQEAMAKIAEVEAEICCDYEISGDFTKMPSVYFKQIRDTLSKPEKTTEKPKASADRPRRKDDRAIEPDEYDELYEAVKTVIVNDNGESGFEELQLEDLKERIELKIREWTGCASLTTMTEKQWQRGMDTATFKPKAEGKKNE